MEDLSLEQLANLVHFSPSYLSRLFHAETGLTVRNYIYQKRIEHASYFLKHTGRTLSNIAGDCGFKNLSHFHRVYKEFTGSTPIQTRRLEAWHAD